MPQINLPTHAKVEEAIATLEQYGRAAFAKSETRRGTAIGYALYGLMSAAEVVDVAIEALEEWNGHLSVAALRAIERGDGEISRQGRDLRIRLPKHWS
jgi:hypothetical protein